MMKKNIKLTPEEMIKKHLSKENKISPPTDLLQIVLIAISITILVLFLSAIALLIVWNFLILAVFAHFSIFIPLINIWVSIGMVFILNLIRSFFIK